MEDFKFPRKSHLSGFVIKVSTTSHFFLVIFVKPPLLFLQMAYFMCPKSSKMHSHYLPIWSGTSITCSCTLCVPGLVYNPCNSLTHVSHLSYTSGMNTDFQGTLIFTEEFPRNQYFLWWHIVSVNIHSRNYHFFMVVFFTFLGTGLIVKVSQTLLSYQWHFLLFPRIFKSL